MQPFKIFKGCLPFERPKDASPKMRMRVQLLGFIATNSSAMTEHRYAVYVGMSNDYIPQGSLCAVLSKIAVCRPVYAGSAHSEFPTEPQCSMSSNTGRWAQFLIWKVEDFLILKGANGMEALVFLMICAAFYFAGTIKDSDVF